MSKNICENKLELSVKVVVKNSHSRAQCFEREREREREREMLRTPMPELVEINVIISGPYMIALIQI